MKSLDAMSIALENSKVSSAGLRCSNTDREIDCFQLYDRLFDHRIYCVCAVSVSRTSKLRDHRCADDT